MTLAATIWEYVFRTGVCDAKEVAADLHLHRRDVQRALSNMAKLKSVRRYEKDADKPSARLRYGVTADCVTPFGVPVKAIIQ